MPISNIIRVIDAADATRNAAKVPEWHGYVYKTTTGLSDADIAAGKYKLIFVKANGDQYVFQWDGLADFTYLGYIANDDGALGTGSPVPGTTLVFDQDLLEAVAEETWTVGAQATFESRRTADSNW